MRSFPPLSVHFSVSPYRFIFVNNLYHKAALFATQNNNTNNNIFYFYFYLFIFFLFSKQNSVV